VTDEQWERYLRQGVPFRLEARPAVARDNELPMRLTRGPGRLGRPGRFQVDQQFFGHQPAAEPFRNGIGPTLGDGRDLVIWTPADQPLTRGDEPADGSRTWLLYLQPQALAALDDGPQAARVGLIASIVDTQESGVAAAVAASAAAAQATPWSFAAVPRIPRHPIGRVDMSAPFRLEPAGTATGRAVVHPDVRQRVRGALTADPIELDRNRDGLTAIVSVTARAPPIGLGMTMAIRAGGREWPTPGGTFPPGVTQTADAAALVGGLPDDVDKVDLVLRPDPWYAGRLVDPDYWGEEIVLNDVPVRRRPVAREAPRPRDEGN
jgi:hypothetical protein